MTDSELVDALIERAGGERACIAQLVGRIDSAEQMLNKLRTTMGAGPWQTLREQMGHAPAAAASDDVLSPSAFMHDELRAVVALCICTSHGASPSRLQRITGWGFNEASRFIERHRLDREVTP